MGRKSQSTAAKGKSKKKVFRPHIFDHDALGEAHTPAQTGQTLKLRNRITRSLGGWLRRRLQKRVEQEWRDYKQPPEVSVRPLFRSRRHRRGEPQVYRSLVQIHFHPRARE